MASNKRVRIFAGPNGSGKSSLFEAFQDAHKDITGYFINADLIEKKLLDSSLLDLKSIGLVATQTDLENFKKLSNSQTLIDKAKTDEHEIDVHIKENCIIDNSIGSHSYEGSFIASFIRHLLVEQHKSFSFETVMSHPSKVEEIKQMAQLGYQPYLYFVCIDKPEVNISRISNRVSHGGHDVPDTKVLERYVRTLELLPSLLPFCYRAYLFDNSGKKNQLIAECYKGDLELKTSNPPQWFMDYVLPNFV